MKRRSRLPALLLLCSLMPAGIAEGRLAPGAEAPTLVESAPMPKRPASGSNDQALSLDVEAVRLPPATLGKAYRHQIRAKGGTPPYRYQLLGGPLPDELLLDVSGKILGTPVVSATRRIRVQVSDQSGQSSQQTYLLSVRPPRKAGPHSAQSVAAPTLSHLTEDEARQPLVDPSRIDVYRLSAKTLEDITAPPTEQEIESSADAASPLPQEVQTGMAGKDVPEELSDAALAQIKQMLTPLIEVEYPNRALFVASLDTQVCRYAAALLIKTVASHHATISDETAQEKVCPAAGTVKPKAGGSQASNIAFSELPGKLLPKDLREQIIAESQQSVALAGVIAPQWQGSGCNCLRNPARTAVYGFVPVWHEAAKSPPVDFGILTRINLFALPIDNNGNVTPLDLDNPAQVAFLRNAHNHGTKIDLTLYRNSWQFLHGITEDRRNWIIGNIVSQSLALIDHPMPGWSPRWHSWLPGPGFSSAERVADGLTVYLDNPPPISDKELFKLYLSFRVHLIQKLIAALRRSPYPHTLNIVLSDTFISNTARLEGDPGWRIGTLFDYLAQAEDPQIKNDRVFAENGIYKSRTSLTLNFIVQLTEPTSDSKRQLRSLFENTSDLHGENRSILMHKIIPLVSIGSADSRQFLDDMAYFSDNFGGVALWPRPVRDDSLSRSLANSLRNTFLAGQPREIAVCTLVCEWHWPLRALFFALLLIWIVTLALYRLSPTVRGLGRPIRVALLLGCLPPIVIGASLLQCDPELDALRQDNTMLFVLIALLLLSALFPLLKPKVETP